MAKTWMTKWGPRKVREIPPTLEEAFVAAECLTEDLDQKIEIAASLMGLPVEEVRGRAPNLAGQPPRASVMTGRGRPVVVQYKRPRLTPRPPTPPAPAARRG